MTIRYIFLFLALSTLLLGGCATGRNTPPERQQVVEEDLLKAGYMGRFMLPYDNRQWFLRDLKLTNFSAGLSDYDAISTTISIPAPTIGMALDVIGLLGPSGRQEYISKLYLPAELNGVAISDVETARRVGIDYLSAQVALAAQRMGRTFRCIDNCRGYTPTFELIQEQATSDNDPKIFVTLIAREMQNATNDPFRDAILGFKPAWESANENGWPICVGKKIKKTGDGQYKTINVEGAGVMLSNFCFSMFASTDEMILLRTLTSDGYYVFGADRYQHILALRGRLFHVGGRRYNKFITYEILPDREST